MSRITGIGAPTRHTKGKVGDTYLDSATNDLYKCVQSYYSYDKLDDEETILYAWIDLNRQDILTAGGGKDEIITFELITDETTGEVTSPYSATELVTYHNAGVMPFLVYEDMVMLPTFSSPEDRETAVWYEYSYAYSPGENQLETRDLYITILDDKTVEIDDNGGELSAGSGSHILEATQDPDDYTKYTCPNTPEEIMNLNGPASLVVNNSYYTLTEANDTRAVFIGTETSVDENYQTALVEPKYAIVNTDGTITFDDAGTLVVSIYSDSNKIGHLGDYETVTKDYIASRITKRPIMLYEDATGLYYTFSGNRSYRYEFTAIDITYKKIRMYTFYPGGDDSSTSTSNATWVYSEMTLS